MAGASLLLPAGLWVLAVWTGDPVHEAFRGEDNAVTWFSTLQLLVIAAAAWSNHRVAALARASRRDSARWIWAAFAAGFVLLAVDERFELHEWLRDDVLVPRGLFAGWDFLEPGEIGLYLVLAAGLLLTCFLFDELRSRPLAVVLYGCALGLAAVVTVLGSVRGEITRAWEHRAFWRYVFEETGELWAQTLFLLAFLVVLADRLRGRGEERS